MNLHHGKSQPDTVSWSFAKRQPLECTWKQLGTLWSKSLRLGIVFGIMMNGIDWCEAKSSLLDGMLRTGDRVVVQCLTRQNDCRRIFAKRFWLKRIRYENANETLTTPLYLPFITWPSTVISDIATYEYCPSCISKTRRISSLASACTSAFNASSYSAKVSVDAVVSYPVRKNT